FFHLSPLSLLFHFFFYSSSDPRDLHSFPTRRSSDLGILGRVAPVTLGLEIAEIDLLLQARLDVGDRPADLARHEGLATPRRDLRDRKSTRLNSSHDQISYAVFCLKKKKKKNE